ncbi:bifunctional phosphopantothenoylcysteine decarboxylase/phosphopantothenate--cysteine ligase CoaBC [Methylobacillus flagellatus]|uniref:bifunctional phosphopantothenoylcysteine decarboxylase/phosphopantothenate--cysteine ligase CoaBC n=1 Tax=Methylobacillus flagellatus TaxID=405 RepID=UPI002853F01A|nr:bifunctional phosphopantothenoylcysteine decarboxylase/phosphopantothenate--cysteine ligase CoaBC [Methylobacillus flagellatus]MDR5170330.1 bifunctional phosphopantothenoylcysteine decarboxylase/phosphopantothenate--cysteine ligase CoaBC [Methylobacillus flagellatus]
MSHYSIKKLLLGVTGGIAAYKAAELVRLLVKQDIEVQVVMTSAATQFVTPMTFQALSGKPVYTDLWQPNNGNGMAHIDLSRQVDAVLVAPASADFLAKLVHGAADDLLSTLCLARDCKLLVAPAMNQQMWNNPATQRNIRQLQHDGISILGPASGSQACGETGPGRMLEPEELVERLLSSSQPKLFAGRRILITAGPTQETIDPVRVITNHSSGKMGYSIARAAIEMGAEVTLVSGPVALQAPSGANTIPVTSAQEMLAAVEANMKNQDIFISVAAVADYRPVKASQHKIKKSAAPLTITLEANPDILATVASRPDAPFCVGFAAESENLLQYADEKRRRKRLPLIAANIASEALGQDQSSLVLLDDEGAHPLPQAPKLMLARSLLQHIAAMMDKNRVG